MTSLLLDDFENMNLPKLEDDVSHVISLNNAFDILLTCEKKEIEYGNLPKKLREGVDYGLANGITEVRKIKTLLDSRLHNQLKDPEKVYLYMLLNNFSHLDRNELVAASILKGDLSKTDILHIENAQKRLDVLEESLEKLKKNKRIKHTELAEKRLEETFNSLGKNLFDKWSSIVSSLEAQEVY